MKPSKGMISIVMVLCLVMSVNAMAETRFTILHTNDLHSHLLGFSPNIDYTPDILNDDLTQGGWARLATAIEKIRQARPHPVLVLDAGDFMMGSLFHLPCREQAIELSLMNTMGYDMLTLGNHEFDLFPDGLARIIKAAEQKNQLPPIVLANAVFSDESAKDDTLAAMFAQGLVRPFRIIERQGVRIGIFGLLGKNAAEVAPFAKPVTFADPVQTAKTMVNLLRNQEKADLVICLSHGAISEDESRSEDEILARETTGIDIIISGHTHTRLEKPIQIKNTLIVQAGSYGRDLGVLDVTLADGKLRLNTYELIPIDDRIPGDKTISERILAAERIIDENILANQELSFRQPIAHTDFDLTLAEDESNLGNLIADAIRWYANQHVYDPKAPGSKVVFGVISNGVIRDAIKKGNTGNVAVCDVFRAIPLGVNFDENGTLGYPLISIYLYASELKKGFEVLTSIYPLKGGDYFLQFSGARVTYNPHRMLFDRVTRIELGSEAKGYVPLDYGESNHKLYRVTADIYNATFLKVVGDFTWQILKIIPKDRDGNPIDDLLTARIDADPEQAGIQELKEWAAVMAYIREFPDSDGDGLPDIPDKYKETLGRQTREANWNPLNLVKNGTYVTWTVLAAGAFFLVLIIGAAWFVGRKIRRRG